MVSDAVKTTVRNPIRRGVVSHERRTHGGIGLCCADWVRWYPRGRQGGRGSERRLPGAVRTRRWFAGVPLRRAARHAPGATPATSSSATTAAQRPTSDSRAARARATSLQGGQTPSIRSRATSTSRRATSTPVSSSSSTTARRRAADFGDHRVYVDQASHPLPVPRRVAFVAATRGAPRPPCPRCVRLLQSTGVGLLLRRPAGHDRPGRRHDGQGGYRQARSRAGAAHALRSSTPR